MALLPNDLTDDTIVDPAKIMQNDEALETAIEGNLTEANFSSATRVPNSYLANDDFVFVLPITIIPVANYWLVGATGTVQAAAHLPYDSTEGNSTYTILSAQVVYRHANATVPDFTLDWGYFDANGAWNNTTNIVATTAIADTDATTATIGALQSSLTLANTSVTTSSTQERVFAVRNSTTDPWTAVAGDFFTVTIKLKRALRS